MKTLTKEIHVDNKQIDNNIYSINNSISDLKKKADRIILKNNIIFGSALFIFAWLAFLLNSIFPFSEAMDTVKNNTWALVYIPFFWISITIIWLLSMDIDKNPDEVIKEIKYLEKKKIEEEKKRIKEQDDILTKALSDTKKVMEYTEKIQEIYSEWGTDGKMIETLQMIKNKA